MKFMKFHTFLTVLPASLGLGIASALAGPIDLTTWQQEGPLSNGRWTVSGDGTSVVQSINGNPTFFVSPDYFLNNSFEGEFRVQTTSDDDYIGFVLFTGTVNDPFYLFDWKQANQSGSTRGFYFSEVTGGAGAIPFGNHHLSSTGYTVIDTNLGIGWADHTTYGFSLDYTATNITIGISGGVFGGGTTIFDIDGIYEEARFGFYNFSQANVLYQGFTEEIIIVPSVPEANSTLMLTMAGILGLLAMRATFRRV